MFFHVDGILVGIEVSVFQSVGSSAVTEDMLGDLDTCHLV
jgi:hypothetical protein